MKGLTKFARNGGGTIGPAAYSLSKCGTASPASTSRGSRIPAPLPRRSLGVGGFTLLELLVAMTITLALAGLMLAIVTNTLGQWHRTEGRASTAAQAKLALDLLERDLQAAMFRKDGVTWLAVNVTNTPTDLTNHGWLLGAASLKPATAESQRLLPDVVAGRPPSIAEARFGLSGAWLRFITTNVESGGSLPVAVAWQIARRPVSGSVGASNPAEVSYTLFRAAVSAEDTFASGNDVTAAAYVSASTTPATPRSPATLANPSSSDVIATNVVDFGTWLYVRDSAGGLRRIFPADSGDLDHVARDSGAAPDANRCPDVADVMIRILTEQGAAEIAEIESGHGRLVRPSSYPNDAEWWWAVVEASSHVYTRRVEVKGAEL